LVSSAPTTKDVFEERTDKFLGKGLLGWAQGDMGRGEERASIQVVVGREGQVETRFNIDLDPGTTRRRRERSHGGSGGVRGGSPGEIPCEELSSSP
jgi:hypothetical protein